MDKNRSDMAVQNGSPQSAPENTPQGVSRDVSHNLHSVYRILDANLNRAVEGVRVVEDLARFSLDNQSLMERCREIRHFLRKSFAPIISSHIQERDSETDVGKAVSQKSQLDKKTSLQDVATANCKRATEALRVIEEYTKVIGQYQLAKSVETRRYEFYTVEKAVLVELASADSVTTRPAGAEGAGATAQLTSSKPQCVRQQLMPGLYGITGEPFAKGRTNIECVQAMIAGGIKTIQYREKGKTMSQMYHEAKAIAKLCKEAGVTFIVNDHIDIALLVEADGVHVGQDDMPVAEVRRLVGSDKLIGLSTHSPEDATAAQEAADQGLIDYIGVGPIFPTTTKDRAAVGLEYLEWVTEHIGRPSKKSQDNKATSSVPATSGQPAENPVSVTKHKKLPYVAIGGIKLHNLDQVLAYGPDHVCLVSGVVGADDIALTTQRINEKIFSVAGLCHKETT